MNLIVVYDIGDNRKRQAFAEKLQYLGLARVQRSVFVGKGGSGLAKDIMRIAQRLIDPKNDSVIIFIVPGEAIRKAMIVGTPWGEPHDIQAVTII